MKSNRSAASRCTILPFFLSLAYSCPTYYRSSTNLSIYSSTFMFTVCLNYSTLTTFNSLELFGKA
ncbi:hypothetical protein P3X46_007237 [Hevea brasiliensis]|uniref:Uncharacterized protein n=1 Tax=Hevea brasiliensis TaxID=3981 RepID=A0ABQ9MSW0_HEVBR|nr:hypothetical protein P3X46_007237 [Hevea brasiliensis]